MVLSALERRWLLHEFSCMNIIDGRFLLLDGKKKEVGVGAFGKVDVVTYRKAGIAGTFTPSIARSINCL